MSIVSRQTFREGFRASGLSVAIGDRRIVENITFDIQPGSFVIVVGPNGAGKTTLLRAMAGLAAYSGSLEFDGVEISRMKAAPRARAIGYLPQNGGAQWPMRVRDVVALGRLPFGASLQKLSKADVALVEQALADCDAAHLADCSATELSGGELSRVLLARVFASDTPVILADEPTASLDPAHQISIMRALARAAASGRIVVAVSHDIGMATQYATRLLGMERGIVACDGKPADLLDSGRLEHIFGVRFHRFEVDGAPAIAIASRIVQGE